MVRMCVRAGAARLSEARWMCRSIWMRACRGEKFSATFARFSSPTYVSADGAHPPVVFAGGVVSAGQCISSVYAGERGGGAAAFVACCATSLPCRSVSYRA